MTQAEKEITVQAWVWQGELVLKNYGTGLVVVLAASCEEAWARVRAEQPGIWFHLTYGQSTIWDNELDRAIDMLDDDDRADALKNGFPVQPVAYDLDKLPVLARWGSE